MTFGCPSDLRTFSFVWTTTKNATQYRQCGICPDFIHSGEYTYCAHRPCDQPGITKKRLPPVPRSDFILLHDGFNGYLLPSLPERTSIKAFGQKENMSYQHTTVFWQLFHLYMHFNPFEIRETIKQNSFSFPFASAVLAALSDVYSSQSHHNGWL